MEDVEPDIFLPNLLEWYAARPSALNDIFLAVFVMWYEVTGSKCPDDTSEMILSSKIPETEDEDPSPAFILSDKFG